LTQSRSCENPRGPGEGPGPRALNWIRSGRKRGLSFIVPIGHGGGDLHWIRSWCRSCVLIARRRRPAVPEASGGIDGWPTIGDGVVHIDHRPSMLSLAKAESRRQERKREPATIRAADFGPLIASFPCAVLTCNVIVADFRARRIPLDLHRQLWAATTRRQI
jgi:hypothetical protein